MASFTVSVFTQAPDFFIYHTCKCFYLLFKEPICAHSFCFFFGFGSEMWGGFIFFKGKERPMGLISHTSHTLIIQSFQHSSWITSAHSLVHLVQILKHLCEWKLSLPVQSEMKQAPGPACIISYEKKEQILRKHHKSVSQQQQLWETKHHQQVDLRYCKQMNIYIDIYINKGIVAVDCTESQLLL